MSRAERGTLRSGCSTTRGISTAIARRASRCSTSTPRCSRRARNASHEPCITEVSLEKVLARRLLPQVLILRNLHRTTSLIHARQRREARHSRGQLCRPLHYRLWNSQLHSRRPGPQGGVPRPQARRRLQLPRVQQGHKPSPRAVGLLHLFMLISRSV